MGFRKKVAPKVPSVDLPARRSRTSFSARHDLSRQTSIRGQSEEEYATDFAGKGDLSDLERVIGSPDAFMNTHPEFIKECGYLKFRNPARQMEYEKARAKAAIPRVRLSEKEHTVYSK